MEVVTVSEEFGSECDNDGLLTENGRCYTRVTAQKFVREPGSAAPPCL